jgi:hypothetical protein
MSVPPRVGRMERNLALFPGWQLGRQAHRSRLEREDFLGAIASVEGAELGEIELDVLSWLTEQWWQQGAPPDGLMRFTWYRLGRDLWNAEPGGRERRLMQEAVGNLMTAVVTLSGFNVHSGRNERGTFSEVHILRSVVGRRRRAGADAAADGGRREDTAEARLEDWLVAQLLGDYGFVLDWQVRAALTGAAKRLWYYLGARSEEFEQGPWPGERVLELELTAQIYHAFSLLASRERANRTSLSKAGERIVEADPRYRSIAVEQADGRYRLRAVRVEELALGDPGDIERSRGADGTAERARPYAELPRC